jgi:hypothetical protein
MKSRLHQHKDAVTLVGVFLVDNDNTGGYARAVRKGWQANR